MQQSGGSSSAATVYLNVYDLVEQNNLTTACYWCGVGIFHSGVEVYGVSSRAEQQAARLFARVLRSTQQAPCPAAPDEFFGAAAGGIRLWRT